MALGQNQDTQQQDKWWFFLDKMKFILLAIIHLYWFFKPKNSKPKCIFCKSCSHYIYETALNKGLLKGLEAFYYRYKNCRYGYEIFKNPITGEFQILLSSGSILPQEEISKRLLIFK